MIKETLDRFIRKAGGGGHFQLSASLIMSAVSMGVLLLLFDGSKLNELGILVLQMFLWLIPAQIVIGLYLWFSPDSANK